MKKSQTKTPEKKILSQKKDSKQIRNMFAKGQRFLKQGQFDKAKKQFQNIIDLNSSRLTPARFFLAETLFKMKKIEPALSVLRVIQTSDDASSDWKLKSLNLEWEILQSHPSAGIEEKLLVQSQIIKNSSTKKQKQTARDIVSLLIQDLSLSQARSLIRRPKLTPIKDLLLFHIAKDFTKNKRFQKALNRFRELLGYVEDNNELEKTALQYIQALMSRTKVNPKTIGVILPLTGPHKRIGYRCLNGIQMGLGLYDSKPSDFQLAIADSKGTPELIPSAVKQLLLEREVIGLIGGAASPAAVQIAESAQNLMIPSILLSQKSGLTQAGSYVFQNAVNSRHIVESLVDTLIDKLDHKQFAILYPNDPFGVEYANLFWDRVNFKNKEITGIETYKPEETDFNDSIKRLVGSYYMEDRDEEYQALILQHLEKENTLPKKEKLKNLLPPITNFSVLFIPDSIKSLELIAPYLSFHNVENVALAGPGLWNSPKLLKKNQPFKEEILFADSLITNHKNFKNSSFFTQFQNIFGYKPGLFELLSYEASLAFRQVIEQGSRSREKLKESLARTKHLESPLGTVKISKNREFIHPITVFSLKEGHLQSLP